MSFISEKLVNSKTPETPEISKSQSLDQRLSPFRKLQENFKEFNKDQKPLTWKEFNKDQDKFSGRRVVVTQPDFTHGTLRLKASVWLQLGEDISFNPNRGFNCKINKSLKECDPTLENGNNWFPTKQQLLTDYDRHAYRLGFFTAITVETKNIWIDLNKFTLQQSEEHRLMQRFYSNIELSDQPFLPKQGPAEFGPGIDAGENVIVSNGSLGLSSHHGIHGNNNKNILFENLTLKRYEVAGIALNGAQRVTYNKVDLLGNDDQIPVLGTFSALRFLDQFTTKTLEYGKNENLEQKLYLSRLAQQQIYYNTILKKKGCIHGIDKKLHGQINDNFINESGLVDGNPYGILHNAPGVAVNNFTEKVDKYQSRDVLIYNTNVYQTRGNITEIIALAKNEGGKYKNVVDTAGSVLQINNITTRYGRYRYTILSDYKISLAEVANNLPEIHRKHYGTLYIPKEIVDWARSRKSIKSYIKYGGGEGEYRKVRNGDSMNHQQKSVLGIRVDGVDGITLEKVQINKVYNAGGRGLDDKYYLGSKDGGHSSQSGSEPNLGYMGCDARGIGLFSTKNFLLKQVKIQNIVSDYGKSIGLDVQGITNGNNVVYGVKISNVIAGRKDNTDHGPSKNTNVAVAAGFRFGPGVENVFMDKSSAECVKGGSIWVKSSKYVLDTNGVYIGANTPKNTDQSETVTIMFIFLIIFFLIFLIAYFYRRRRRRGGY